MILGADDPGNKGKSAFSKPQHLDDISTVAGKENNLWTAKDNWRIDVRDGICNEGMRVRCEWRSKAWDGVLTYKHQSPDQSHAFRKTITMRYIITSSQPNTYSPTTETQINFAHNNTTSDNTASKHKMKTRYKYLVSTHMSNLNFFFFYIQYYFILFI